MTLIDAIEGFAAPISVVVTLGLFAYAQVATLRSSRKRARDAAISEVLAALERLTRRRTWPSVARIWHKPEIDYALLVPRLLVGLHPRDRIVATWLTTQVNLMNAATSQGAVFQLALNASTTIANWHIGTVHRSWFETEVAAHRPRLPRGTVRVLLTSLGAGATLWVSGFMAGAVASAGASLAHLRVRKAFGDD